MQVSWRSLTISGHLAHFRLGRFPAVFRLDTWLPPRNSKRNLAGAFAQGPYRGPERHSLEFHGGPLALWRVKSQGCVFFGWVGYRLTGLSLTLACNCSRARVQPRAFYARQETHKRILTNHLPGH